VASTIALAALTLGVFLVLRDYGPGTALRRFHVAVLRRDQASIRAVVTSDSSDQAVSELASTVVGFALRGWRYQFLGTEPFSRDAVKAEINYISPSGQRAVPTFWIVRKSRGVWRIDADTTWRLAIFG
jgi:hypothetical protein